MLHLSSIKPADNTATALFFNFSFTETNGHKYKEMASLLCYIGNTKLKGMIIYFIISS